MAWLEVHQTLRDHRKTLATADALDIEPPYALGLLVSLWLWSLDNAPDGYVSGISNKTMARAAQWGGDADLFVKTLISTGWINNTENGLEIHDWYEYTGKLIDRRKNEKEYKTRQRELYADMRLIKQVKARDGDTCQYCGRTVNWLDRKGTSGGTYDHIDPDGGNTLENICVCCRGCNSKKGGRTPDEARMQFIESSPLSGGVNKKSTINLPDTVENQYKKSTINLPDTVENQYKKSTITVPNSTVPNSTDIASLSDDGDKQQPIPFENIKKLFNTKCLSFPKVLKIDGQRRKAVAARWKTYKDITAFETLFQKTEASSFLKGQNDRNWSPTFDWLMITNNFSKVIEGLYDEKGGDHNGLNRQHTGRNGITEQQNAGSPQLSGFHLAGDDKPEE